jgi:hypothetical protein
LVLESGVVDDTMYRSGLSEQYEVQANRMAADILMVRRPITRCRMASWGKSLRFDLIAVIVGIGSGLAVAVIARLTSGSDGSILGGSLVAASLAASLVTAARISKNTN